MRKQNLTGKKFGKLTVIQSLQSIFDGKRNRTVWKCKCDCGNYSFHRTDDLKTGDSTSCGCVRKQYREIDLVGMRFNNLFVLKKILKGKYSEVHWLCRCDCGKECEVISSALRNSWQKSCGCIKDIEEETLLTKFFWKNVKKNDYCWEWTGKLCNGYGAVEFHKKQFRAHRLSYIIHNGSIEKNKFICHKCDNKKCVNPSHLYAGTINDNARDAKERNLIHRGEQCVRSKLKEIDILKILASKETCRDIAIQYNMNKNYIRKIRNRQAWRHITVP